MGSLTVRVGRALLLLLILTIHRGGVPAEASSAGWGGFFGRKAGTTSEEQESASSKWSSLMTVDPSKVVSLMVKHGGFLLPQSSENDIKDLAKLCHCDKCQLNILDKALVIHNFTVRMPNEDEPALKVGRVSMKWDSYLKPCVEIYVDDVDVFVAFFNVLLTRNNWDELRENGFPPTFEDNTTPDEDDNSSFVRVGGIDLSGNVTLKLSSRALDRELGKLQLDLDTFDPLDREIRNLSLEKLSNSGRRGCTTDELYGLIQTFFKQILKTFVYETANDLIRSGGVKGSQTVERLNSMLQASRDSIENNYLDGVRDWSNDQMEKNLKKQLAKLKAKSKLDEPGNEQVKETLSNIAKHLQNSDYAKEKRSQLEEAYKSIPFLQRRDESEQDRMEPET